MDRYPAADSAPANCPCGGHFIYEDRSFDAHVGGRLAVVRQHGWTCDNCGADAEDVLSAEDYRLLTEPPEPEWGE